MLDADPGFARQALSSIESSARTGLRDLDYVLGLLRDDTASRTPAPTLADLDRLLDQTRAAGIDVRASASGPLDAVPRAVSREAYRIVQEGLTNAARHAGRVPVALRLWVGDDRLELELSNPLPAATGDTQAAADGDRGGGRGLAGIKERVAALRGSMSASADGDHWRLTVKLPLRRLP